MTSFKRIIMFLFVFIFSLLLNGHGAQAAENSVGSDKGEDGQYFDISVAVKWDDCTNKDGIRPDRISVRLYANGVETGEELVLEWKNGFRGTFEGMPRFKDGVRRSYSIVENKIEGYTGTICGSDSDGYTITNIHELLPEGRSGQEEIDRHKEAREAVVETVVTTKVSTSMPMRTSTTIKKTRSAKTADQSEPVFWGTMLLCSAAVLYIWMRIEQKRE